MAPQGHAQVQYWQPMKISWFRDNTPVSGCLVRASAGQPLTQGVAVQRLQDMETNCRVGFGYVPPFRIRTSAVEDVAQGNQDEHRPRSRSRDQCDQWPHLAELGLM